MHKHPHFQDAKFAVSTLVCIGGALAILACSVAASNADDVTGAGPFGNDTVERRGDVAVAAAPIVQPMNTRRAAMLLLHFGEPDNSINRDLMQARLFGHTPPTIFDPGSLTTYYEEVSYGALGFTGDVYDWIQIPQPADPCNTDQTRAAAELAAQSHGIDLSQYQHVLIYLTAACGNTPGQAELGTKSAPGRYSWYYYDADVGNFVHEMGHNLGLSHANFYACGVGSSIATADRCVSKEYGDPFDPMGDRFPEAQVSAYNKALEGWLDRCNVLTVPSGGAFTLQPLEVGTDAPQALRVPLSLELCPIGISPCYYYVEFRQPIGFDGLGPNASSPMHQGATIRIAGDINRNGASSGVKTQLLTMHPATPENPTADPYHAQLLPGETFRDPTGVSIAVESQVNQTLSLRVEVPGGSGAVTCIDGTSACDDGVRDGRETDLDCGGNCGGCDVGQTCSAGSDCASGNCQGGSCAASRVTATLQYSSRWATGYCAEIRIRNVSSAPLSSWRVQLSVGSSVVTSSWLAQFTAPGPALYDVTPFSWNSVIQPGQFVSANYCANWTGSTEPQILNASNR